jgi:hypothetical protein
MGLPPGQSSGICGGQSGTGTGFLQVLWFPPVNIIPPWNPFFQKLKKKFLSFTHAHPGMDKGPIKAAAVQ